MRCIMGDNAVNTTANISLFPLILVCYLGNELVPTVCHLDYLKKK